ncbi:MAG: prephenate dehydrogenase/arogenate dehydrogenase family protein, partial [Actinomycetia bacterium]|nr:prephenate dehydrogenase/arogenate dehydrogenase family protein [Actinomycetes bacterium]
MMKTVGIIGLGLMGGSFAKTIHAKGDLRTLGFDIDDAIMTQALDEGVIAEGLDPQNLGECDLVIVALRPHDAITWIKENADHMKSGAIIADV